MWYGKFEVPFVEVSRHKGWMCGCLSRLDCGQVARVTDGGCKAESLTSSPQLEQVGGSLAVKQIIVFGSTGSRQTERILRHTGKVKKGQWLFVV